MAIFILISLCCFFMAYKLFAYSSFSSLVFAGFGVVSLAIMHRRKQARQPRVTVTIQQQPRHGGLKPKFETIGNIDPVCPYCNQMLDKKPGRKKKCPHCSNFIYVRTRPSDEQQVLVTKEQAEKIEEQWSIMNGTHEYYLAAKQKFQNERNALQERFGHPPSDNDVRWSMLNKDMIEHARHRDWGLFRNAKFDMAEILRREDRLMGAMELYLEICYLDLNGPNNMGGITEQDILREFPPWDPKGPAADIAPGIIARICRIIKETKTDRNRIEEIYQNRALSLYKSLCLPVSPSVAWQQISEALFEEE